MLIPIDSPDLRYYRQIFQNQLSIPDKPNILIIPGGGARTFYAIGYVSYLIFAGIRMDLILATSAGCLAASFFSLVSSEKDKVWDFLKIIEQISGYDEWLHFIGLQKPDNNITPFNLKGLEGFLTDKVNEMGFSDFIKLNIPVGFMGIDSKRSSKGKAGGCFLAFGKDGVPTKEFVQAIVASSSLPGTNPVRIYDHEIVDGGEFPETNDTSRLARALFSDAKILTIDISFGEVILSPSKQGLPFRLDDGEVADLRAKAYEEENLENKLSTIFKFEPYLLYLGFQRAFHDGVELQKLFGGKKISEETNPEVFDYFEKFNTKNKGKDSSQ